MLYIFRLHYLFFIFLFPLYLSASDFNEMQKQSQPHIKAVLESDNAQIVIDWPKKVKLSHVKVGNRLIVSFSMSVDVSPKRIVEEIGSFLKTMNVQSDSRVLIFELKDGIDFDVKEKGHQTLIYFFRKGNQSPAPQEVRIEEDSNKPFILFDMKFEAYEFYDRVFINWGKENEVDFKTSFEKGIFEIAFNQSGTLQESVSLAPSLKTVQKFEVVNEAPFTVRFYLQPAVEVIPHKGENELRLDFAPSEARDFVKANSEDKINIIKQDKNLFEPYENETLTIDVGEPLGLYIFQRGSFLYIGLPYQLQTLEGVFSGREELISLLEEVTTSDGKLLRLKLSPEAKISLRRENTAWQIIFNPQQEEAKKESKPLKVIYYEEEKEGVNEPKILIKGVEANSLLEFRDPILGDKLQAIPLSEPGSSMDSYHFVDFDLLKTSQGIVIKPHTDKLSIRSVEEGLLFSKEGEDKLYRIAQEDRQLILSKGESFIKKTNSPLFNFVQWRGGAYGDFKVNEEAFFQLLSHADSVQKMKLRLDLARFYLSYGMGSETLGILSLLGKEMAGIDQRQDYQLLLGGAAFFNRNYERAESAFNAPSLKDKKEILLWKFLMMRDNPKSLEEPFIDALEIIESYPYPIHGKLAEKALDKLITIKRYDLAELLLNGLESDPQTRSQTEPAILYYRAVIAHQAQQLDKAKALLEKLLKYRDRYYRARGRLEAIRIDFETGAITPEQAIDRLKSLQYAWRGDYFEREVLIALTQANLEGKRYRDALIGMKKIISLFPEHPDTAHLAAQMNDLYENLFLSPLGDQLSAIESYAIFKHFIELLPAGELGNKIVTIVAEKLIAIDLFDKAAEMLDYQVEYRLEGEEKSQIGARLAAIYLLDKKPQKALEALNKTIISDVSEEISFKRQLLRARALLMLKSYKAAEELIAPYRQDDAILLKIDIAWQQKEWMKAASYLENLIAKEESDAFNPKIENYILKLAVALSNADDELALGRLYDLFGSYMAKGKKKDLFDLITRSTQDPNRLNIENIKTQISEVDLFDKVLSNYKKLKISEV